MPKKKTRRRSASNRIAEQARTMSAQKVWVEERAALMRDRRQLTNRLEFLEAQNREWMHTIAAMQRAVGLLDRQIIGVNRKIAEADAELGQKEPT